MGRTAGATAAGTRERLLRAAADVFAARGYDGTRVSDIAEAAELSNGAMYAYFSSKVELLVEALRAHGGRLLADLVAAHPTQPIADLLLQTGRSLRGRRERDDQLFVEALLAARRDRDVVEPVRGYVQERADWLAGLVLDAQARGELDPGLPPRAVAHFCLSLTAGTALVSPDLNDVDEQEWSTLLGRLMTVLAPHGTTPTTPETGTTP
jgi:AcrR family transcriptional regulator